jgi:hypothetical protein
MTRLKNFFLKYGLLICAIAAFTIPLIIYILTLEPKLVGGDTSWFAIYVPRMEVLVPTGYPSFSIFGKLATLLPVKDIAYRLNLMSAIFGALAVLFLSHLLQPFLSVLQYHSGRLQTVSKWIQ